MPSQVCNRASFTMPALTDESQPPHEEGSVERPSEHRLHDEPQRAEEVGSS